MQDIQPQPSASAQPGSESGGLAPAGDRVRDPHPGVAGSVDERSPSISETGISSESAISLEKMTPVHRMETPCRDGWDGDLQCEIYAHFFWAGEGFCCCGKVARDDV